VLGVETVALVIGLFLSSGPVAGHGPIKQPIRQFVSFWQRHLSALVEVDRFDTAAPKPSLRKEVPGEKTARLELDRLNPPASIRIDFMKGYFRCIAQQYKDDCTNCTLRPGQLRDSANHPIMKTAYRKWTRRTLHSAIEPLLGFRLKTIPKTFADLLRQHQLQLPEFRPL